MTKTMGGESETKPARQWPKSAGRNNPIIMARGRPVAVLLAIALVTMALAARAGVVFTSLHSFGFYPNGANPCALVRGADGDFYGTTEGGGTNGGYGTVFKISTNGVVTSLHSFTGGSDGAYPNYDAALVQGSDGDFYGTTQDNGTNGDWGTVFKITPNGVVTSLHSFTGGSDGGYPLGGLVQGSDGDFYGTTSGGGANNAGAVFKITTNGVITTLYSFTGGSDGGNPWTGLVQGSDGDFYGTTSHGGTKILYGTVFKITTNGVLTSLHSFTGGSDGANPYAALVQGSDGDFYGTTEYGGTNNYGIVFKISPAGAFTILHTFTGSGYDGNAPVAALVQGSDGDFYGTTAAGGLGNQGIVFKISSAGVFTNLHSFTGGDGANPYARLAQGSNGNFYGTTVNGGANGFGTVFKISPNGVFTNLYSFPGLGDGGGLDAGLAQGSDGDFYGTTQNGGAKNNGTVFKISPSGVFTNLFSFTGGNDGGNPYAGLELGSNGDFYGTTHQGGAHNAGTVFRITPNGVFTNLFSFNGGNDGGFPYAGLELGSDGDFYGTTYGGGTNGGWGTVFKITTNGVFTMLHTFTVGNDGGSPWAGLVQGSDGDFYGTTTYGGSTNNEGTVFKISPAGVFTTLYSFTGGNDGGGPSAALVQGSDGDFYGTTQIGGANGFGTVFKISASGAFTSLYSFTGGNDGANPYAGLLQGSDGDFYGTTYSGGMGSVGTVFSLSVGLAPGVPIIQTTDGSLGVRTNRFGFNITGVNDSVVVVEASTNLANPVWIPVATNILTGGTSYFYDPKWANYPQRFYRIGSQ